MIATCCNERVWLRSLSLRTAARCLMVGRVWSMEEARPGWGWGVVEIPSGYWEGSPSQTYELLISGICHLIFLDPCWPQVTETLESETTDEGGQLYLLPSSSRPKTATPITTPTTAMLRFPRVLSPSAHLLQGRGASPHKWLSSCWEWRKGRYFVTKPYFCANGSSPWGCIYRHLFSLSVKPILLMLLSVWQHLNGTK